MLLVSGLLLGIANPPDLRFDLRNCSDFLSAELLELRHVVDYARAFFMGHSCCFTCKVYAIMGCHDLIAIIFVGRGPGPSSNRSCFLVRLALIGVITCSSLCFFVVK